MSMFQQASRRQIYLKIGVDGVSGAGKTMSALLLASGMGKKIAVIDTERGSAANYSDKVPFAHVVIAPPFTVDKYIEAIKAAVSEGFEVLVIDSISHEWNGEGGILEQKELYDAANPRSNSYANWRQFSEMHQKFVNTYIQAPIHVIATMRSKMDYSIDKDDSGKSKVTKQGLNPITGKDAEYEFDVVFSVVRERHLATASKDRTGLFGDTPFVVTPDTGKRLMDWRNGAQDPPPSPAPETGDIAGPRSEGDSHQASPSPPPSGVSPLYATLVLSLEQVADSEHVEEWIEKNKEELNNLEKDERREIRAQIRAHTNKLRGKEVA